MTRQRPNILLITTDEHRYDCLGCYGNPVIRTPHIDSIAQEGVRFERGYAQNPMCMPSRMSIMTGRYCSEHGCNINCTGIPAHEQQNTFMQHLCDAGYHTAAIGKMHMMPKWGPFGFSYLDLVEGKADRNNQYTDYLRARGWGGAKTRPKETVFLLVCTPTLCRQKRRSTPLSGGARPGGWTAGKESSRSFCGCHSPIPTFRSIPPSPMTRCTIHWRCRSRFGERARWMPSRRTAHCSGNVDMTC